MAPELGRGTAMLGNVVRRFSLLLVLGAALLALGCNDYDALSRCFGERCQPDASGDAATDGGSADADPCTPTDTDANLVRNGGFEDGCGGDWYAYQSTATPDPIAHCGVRSCRVCLSPSYDVYSLDEGMPWAGGADPAQTLVAMAWVRAIPDAAVPVTPQIVVRLAADAGQHVGQSTGGTTIADSTWQAVRVEYQPSRPGSLLDVYVAGTGNQPGACFLVDDVSVFRR